jgi:hypothetical protein
MISKYNVDLNQLKAYDVANLAQMGSNSTEEGKSEKHTT